MAPPSIQRASILLLAVVAIVLPLAAGAQVSPSIQARIDAAAQEARDLLRQEQVLSRTLRVGDLAQADSLLSRQRTASTLSAVVIGAIAENPAQAGAVVDAAIRAAPEFQDAIVSNTLSAFPGFAGAISAGRTGQPPVAVYRSAPPPSPSPSLAYTPPPLQAPQQASGPAPVPPLTMPKGTTEGRGEPLPSDDDGEIYDPWEGFNRGIFAFNDVLDRFLLKPIAQAYDFVMPDAAKDNIRNAFYNLGEPVRLANDMLQFEGGDAAKTTGRFLVNTTVGIVGLFDVASDWGMSRHPSDFGQTLHSYGSGVGPYLVLPILGPSTLRDGTGTLVDMFFDPRTWLLDFPTNMSITGGKGTVRREELIQPLDDLRENSIDYYSALRSAYFQDRAVDLRRGKAADTSDLDKMFDAVD